MRRAFTALVLMLLASSATGQTTPLRDTTPTATPVEVIVSDLRQAKDDDLPDELVKQIGMLSTADRAAFARSLGDEPNEAEQFAPFLVMMLEDSSSIVRAQAAASLARLGGSAFPAMMEMLDVGRASDPSIYMPDDPDRQVSEYLSWVFANSVADPGPLLMSWAKETISDSPAEIVPDPSTFVSITLGARREKSLNIAQELLRSSSADEQALGVALVQQMGEAAAPAAPAVARLMPSLDFDYEAIEALSEMGDAGQVELARLFADPRMSDQRINLYYAMRPGRASLAAELRVARWSDSEAKELAVRGLVDQPDLPLSAIPILLEAARQAETQDDAFLALSGLALNARQQHELIRLAGAELDRVLALQDTYASAVEAIVALGNTGPKGLELLRNRLSDPHTHKKACTDARYASENDPDARGPATTQARANIRKLTEMLCADVLAEFNYPEVEAFLKNIKQGAGNPVAMLLNEFDGSSSEQVKSLLCASTEFSEQDQIAAIAQYGTMDWLEVADLAERCPRLLVGPPTFLFVGRMLAEGQDFDRWAADYDYSPSQLFAGLSPGAAPRPADWSAKLIRLAQFESEDVRSWAILHLRDVVEEPGVVAALRRALDDRSRSIPRLAAEILLERDPDSPEWPEAAEVAILLGVEEEVEAYADSIGGAFDPPPSEDWQTLPHQPFAELRCPVNQIGAELESTGQVPELIGCRPDTVRPILQRYDYGLTVENRSASTIYRAGRIASQRVESGNVYVDVSTGPDSGPPSADGQHSAGPSAPPGESDSPSGSGAGGAGGALLGVIGKLLSGPHLSRPPPPSQPSPVVSPTGEPPPPPPPPPAPERDGEGIPVMGAGRSLPNFPWPPPRFTSIVTFGRELDRGLLGRPQDNLENVHERLVKALGAIDPGFESGLFAAPGGFVLLTRLEQTNENGKPLPGRDRWRDVRPPPRSATDFLVRLFLAPPGYYRTIAFLFTDRSNFSVGNAPLPAFEEGGTLLPDEVGAINYGSRNAFALIYSFRKRDTGTAQPYRLVSGKQHLEQSGVIKVLQRR